MIGLTIVSIGTSLPELITSVVAAPRGYPDMAVGNIIGSNIFNIFGILGICSIIREQSVSSQVLWIDAPVMAALSLVILPIMKSGNRISRGEGMLLLSGYIIYAAVRVYLQ